MDELSDENSCSGNFANLRASDFALLGTVAGLGPFAVPEIGRSQQILKAKSR
jgi:hypothetical protein